MKETSFQNKGDIALSYYVEKLTLSEDCKYVGATVTKNQKDSYTEENLSDTPDLIGEKKLLPGKTHLVHYSFLLANHIEKESVQCVIDINILAWQEGLGIKENGFKDEEGIRLEVNIENENLKDAIESKEEKENEDIVIGD
jgi:hypothetical protein